ncbi:MAG: hypothetical protein GC155_06625 [Alphaproteobacteria bacterium]|nr:hypothetical protein [Alphaproteobacteria bacterium]
MTFPWRLWQLVLTAFAAFTTAAGMQPGWGGAWWPIAGLWLAASWASVGLSVWAAGCLLLLGLLMDFMSEAPIGAWPLALLCAYGVGLVAWDRSPPVPVIGAELVSVGGGIIACWLALAAAGGISGEPAFARTGVVYDFLITALLYPVARFVLIPASVRGARR